MTDPMAKTEFNEQTSTGKRKPAQKTSQPIGVLQDPSTGKTKTVSDDMLDDFASITQDTSILTDKDGKKDPRRIDIEKEEKEYLKWGIEHGKINKVGEGKGAAYNPAINSEAEKGVLKMYQEAQKQYPGKNIVMEFADGDFRIRNAKSDYSSPIAIFQDLDHGSVRGDQMFFEGAEDDRVIGIPYTIANIGADRYYVINGRVYSGWAMWFGLQAIRAPEDYAKNVDLAYNIPFVWGGFQLKANLSLGASFDITHGTEDDETPEENFLNEIFHSRLQLNTNKLRKTSWHLDLYGNAYWHIRRDAQGFPDKVTILQPERIKVFLDPKTTKVLYYIYLPPVLAGMALTPYPNIRSNPNLMHGPALTYPTPIVIDPQDIIHFKENDFTEFPYGLSCCKPMIESASARLDINIIAPMIFKRYAKPLIHWRLDPMMPFQLTKGQIENYIEGMKATLEDMEPMSDPITSTRWSAQPIGAAQGKAELLTIIQDLDNQIFSAIGVPENYFKPQTGTDRMIAEQDKTLLAAMTDRQFMVGDKIQEMIVRPAIDRWVQIINEGLPENQQVPPYMWNQYPKLQWRETFKQDQVTTIQNTMALLQAGIIDHGRAARRVGEAPPSQSDELSRQQDLQKITEEVQILQAQLQTMQTQMEMMDAEVVMGAGGPLAFQAAQMQAQAEAQGEAMEDPKPDDAPSKDPKAEDTRDTQKLRVTFINRTGKRQTEVMKASTLDRLKSGGVAIEKVEAVGASETSTAAQDKAGEALEGK